MPPAIPLAGGIPLLPKQQEREAVDEQARDRIRREEEQGVPDWVLGIEPALFDDPPDWPKSDPVTDYKPADYERHGRKRKVRRQGVDGFGVREEGPGRAECCGAPLNGDEATGKYYMRHRGGLVDVEQSRPCLAARLCMNAQKRKRVDNYWDDLAKARAAERARPDRMGCCGAPREGFELTSKYYARHRNGSDNISKEPCRQSKLCASRYHATKQSRSREGLDVGV